ncbi:MAG: hypothetical protein CMO80_21155 [Verrucomicrobiales bacterium]|nr:hypothetical protein [Verrucomicrobiales bacterium]
MTEVRRIYPSSTAPGFELPTLAMKAGIKKIQDYLKNTVPDERRLINLSKLNEDGRVEVDVRLPDNPDVRGDVIKKPGDLYVTRIAVKAPRPNAKLPALKTVGGVKLSRLFFLERDVDLHAAVKEKLGGRSLRAVAMHINANISSQVVMSGGAAYGALRPTGEMFLLATFKNDDGDHELSVCELGKVLLEPAAFKHMSYGSYAVNSKPLVGPFASQLVAALAKGKSCLPQRIPEPAAALAAPAVNQLPQPNLLGCRLLMRQQATGGNDQAGEGVAKGRTAGDLCRLVKADSSKERGSFR